MPIIKIESGGRLEITSGAVVRTGEEIILLAPSDISDLHVWWDFSELDGNFVFNDLAGVVPITNGALLRRVNDRSGNGRIGKPRDDADGHAGTWDSGVRNGNGAFSADAIGGSPTVEGTAVNLENELGMDGTTQIFTIGGVGEIPAVKDNHAQELCSMTFPIGCQFGVGRGIADSGASRFIRFFAPSVSNSLGPFDWTTRAGQWFLWLAEVDGASSVLTYNNANSSPPTTHDFSTTVQGGFSVGAGLDLLANVRSSWNAHIGEAFAFDKQLSQAEKDGLFNYLANKWTLTDSV